MFILRCGHSGGARSINWKNFSIFLFFNASYSIMEMLIWAIFLNFLFTNFAISSYRIFYSTSISLKTAWKMYSNSNSNSAIVIVPTSLKSIRSNRKSNFLLKESLPITASPLKSSNESIRFWSPFEKISYMFLYSLYSNILKKAVLSNVKDAETDWNKENCSFN